ncbi:MAG: rhomboid family intramembrane serine protease [Pseudorhodoplanes sp.]
MLDTGGAVTIGRRGDEGFCSYLAKQYIAKRGYEPCHLPEAAALAQHCDILLSFTDGYSLTLMAIVDRESHPGKTFAMSPEEVTTIGTELLKYTGTIQYSKMPVTIHVMEIGPSDPAQQERLSRYKPAGWFKSVLPYGWVIDTDRKTVWTNARYGGRTMGAPFIRQLLTSPREDTATLQASRVAAELDPSFPHLTTAIIAVLSALFAAEVIFAIGPSSGLLQPSIATLLAFGGLYRPLVMEGQWWRLFSAPLLHADLFHLALNCFALFLSGRLLEGLVGRAWLSAIFVIGAIGGSLMSLAVHQNVVSVGASGAIMGLFAALAMLSFHFPKGASRTTLQTTSVYVLFSSVIPLGAGGNNVDYAAHIGGALGGIAVGLLILSIWRKEDKHPHLAPLAGAIGIAGLAAFALSFTPLPKNYRIQSLGAALIPAADLPKTDEEINKRAAELVEKYPRDPRSHYFRGIALWNAGKMSDAESAFRAGLADESLWRPLLAPELAVRLNALLAILLAGEGRKDEAKTFAKTACELAPPGNPQREFLDKYSLCAP